MASRFLRSTLIEAAILVVGATACMGKDPYNPGTSLGTFRVVGTLKSNSCAESPNPWEFDVKLSRDASTLYWLSGGVPASGTIDASSHAILSSIDTRTVRAADPKTKTPACIMARTDTLEATLSKDPISSFIGNLTYRFDVPEDADCSDQLVSSGGGFQALPCEVTYQIAGEKTGDAGAQPL